MFALDLIRGYLPTDPAREYMHVDSINLEHIISTSANNLKGLSIEKFGVFPEIAIRTSQDSAGKLFFGVEPYVHFAFVEILKNSIQAVIDKHGELEIDNLDDPPITVDLSASGNLIRAEVRDDGLGLPAVDYCGRADYDPFDALFTSKQVNTEPTYTYSRDFGVEFSGKGIGLLKSKVYVEMHLGVLELQSSPSAGCTVTITLPRQTGNLHF
jgi:signal transduction histidine kinase